MRPPKLKARERLRGPRPLTHIPLSISGNTSAIVHAAKPVLSKEREGKGKKPSSSDGAKRARRLRRPASAGTFRSQKASIDNTNHAYIESLRRRKEREKSRKMRVLPHLEVSRPEKKVWASFPQSQAEADDAEEKDDNRVVAVRPPPFSRYIDHAALNKKLNKHEPAAPAAPARPSTKSPKKVTTPAAPDKDNSSSSSDGEYTIYDGTAEKEVRQETRRLKKLANLSDKVDEMVKNHDIYTELRLPTHSIVQNGKFIPKRLLRRQILRERFLALAHHYIGVPYAQKYWKPGSPEHESPIFLDCCGLVRKILRDMAQDLNFVVGPWNQAYLFDTLPVEVPFKELKPGDLVFYRAKFYSKRPGRKVQKHDMVHVEIFLGGPTGEGTIGSRVAQAKVSKHSSYRFDSKFYKVYQHHFRSIDPWLDGILKSHCSRCAWTWNKKPPRRTTRPRGGRSGESRLYKGRPRPQSAPRLRRSSTRLTLY